MDGEADWSERYVYWNDSSPNWVNDKLRGASDVLHVFKETCPPRLISANVTSTRKYILQCRLQCMIKKNACNCL